MNRILVSFRLNAVRGVKGRHWTDRCRYVRSAGAWDLEPKTVYRLIGMRICRSCL